MAAFDPLTMEAAIGAHALDERPGDAERSGDVSPPNTDKLQRVDRVEHSRLAEVELRPCQRREEVVGCVV
jgi:hypothetical protein